MKRTVTLFLIVAMFAGFLPMSTLAQTPSPSVSPADAVNARQAELQAQLDQINADIASEQGILDQKKTETASLQRDTAILNAQIAEAKLKAQASALQLQTLSKDIGVKVQTIQTLADRIDKNKESLTQLIRQTNQIDDYSLAEVMLTDQNFSDFFSDVDSYGSIQKSLHDVYLDVTDAKQQTEQEKAALDAKNKAEQDALAVIQANQRAVQSKEKEKANLLLISKTVTQGYATVLAAKQKQAAQIRSALFALRDTAAIPFGTALEYATEASQKTGVRPAFLLAILTQETNLGQNVGQCLLKDPVTGAGVGKNTGTPFKNVMKPGRDIPPFLTLAASLGFDPYNMAVSCPQSVGYGGGMGPAQFIPSTWVQLADRVSKVTGNSPANPWAAKDSFAASSLFLADLGADAGGYSAEYEAAARYYAGGNWKTLGKGYANSVLTIATNIQENMIDPLQNN